MPPPPNRGNAQLGARTFGGKARGGPSPQVRRIDLLVGNQHIGRAVTWSYPSDDGVLYEVPTYELTVTGYDDVGKKRQRKYEVFRFGVQRKDKASKARVVGLANKQTHKIKAWLPNYTVHSAASPEKGAWQVYKGWLIHDGPDAPLSTAQPYASIGCVEICNGPSGFVIFNQYIVELSGLKTAKMNLRTKLTMIGKSGKLVIGYLEAKRPPLKVFTP